MIVQIEENLEQKPEKVSYDTNYFSEANVTEASVQNTGLYIATGCDKRGDVVEMSTDSPPGNES